MAVRNALLGGTDFVSGEVLYDYDLDDTLNALIGKEYADNAGGQTTSASETDLASITITQNDLNDSATLLISAGIHLEHTTTSTTGTSKGDFKIYVDGVAVKTFRLESASSEVGIIKETGTALFHLHTGLDTTAGNKIIKVTGQVDTSTNATTELKCTSLLVEGKNR